MLAQIAGHDNLSAIVLILAAAALAVWIVKSIR